jgi:hypothetical protein
MVEEEEDKEVGRSLLVGMAATVLRFVVAGTMFRDHYAAADFKKNDFCSTPLDFGFSALISGQRAEVFWYCPENNSFSLDDLVVTKLGNWQLPTLCQRRLIHQGFA